MNGPSSEDMGNPDHETEVLEDPNAKKEREAPPSRTYPLPAELDALDPAITYAVPVDKILVPRERVTSVYDAALQEEFEESVRSQGVKDDVILWLIKGDLWLDDGLHRLQVAEKLGIPTVPAKIQKGTLDDLLMSNLVHARQRGKSNPAQEADVIAFLVQNRGFPLNMAAAKMGMSKAWARKLLKISVLPDQVKTLIQQGKIPVTGAFYIADLPNATQQLAVATDAANYKYDAYQVKTRVRDLLNPDVEPQEGEYKFNANGRPERIPTRCRFCQKELPDTGKSYVWVCTDCEKTAVELLRSYRTALNEATSNPPKTVP